MLSPMTDTLFDRSITVAVEHVGWARRQGQTVREVLAALGEEVPAGESWDYVVGRVAYHWRWLQPGAA